MIIIIGIILIITIIITKIIIIVMRRGIRHLRFFLLNPTQSRIFTPLVFSS